MDGMLVNVGAVMGTVHHVERFVARGFSVRIISVLTHASEVPVLLVLSCLQFHVHVEILTLRELHDCPHLCHETCCPGQCPSPDKCTKGLYSLSMPSLEKGDAMSRGFKQYTAKQALIPKIYLKTILDLNFFLGIMLARVKHRSWIRNCICVNPKIWRFQLLKIMYLSTKIGVNDCKSKEDLTNAEDAATMRWLFLMVTLVVTLVAAAYFGYKGLMWLSDWMDEVEEQRDREP
ncbi:NF-X1-type zinc finger protein NFXL2 isoform X4 [Populus trichocarpa]|uniref:NF-X1-type zinc finger protein NFXL2 isoform X4 n=1 Tax=Populus trichocarpa TaxID=3694 RepID=UPI000D18ADED|nr:NF-X1-type zinc finger protein NFXL2 isoform X4 [Populus trichocarpa]|eukprot:XP_024462414.1 NF-X1-type zinc finger protein NFXL2 isoform X4 [Populus trichocarpa]